MCSASGRCDKKGEWQRKWSSFHGGGRRVRRLSSALLFDTLANGGREARGGAENQFDRNENADNRDGHGSRESTAGLTAPVRLFIVGVVLSSGCSGLSDQLLSHFLIVVASSRRVSRIRRRLEATTTTLIHWSILSVLLLRRIMRASSIEAKKPSPARHRRGLR